MSGEIRRYTCTTEDTNESCCAPHRKFADKVAEEGKLLSEALAIMDSIRIAGFGLESEYADRPIAKCLDEEMELNVCGMSSLLRMIVELKERLI